MPEKLAAKTTLLIVEDEPLIRMDVAEFAQEADLATLEAASADEALKIMESRSDIDVVFTDVNMPGSIDGLELSRVIAGRWPAVGVIMTSGLVRPQRQDLEAGCCSIRNPTICIRSYRRCACLRPDPQASNFRSEG